MAMFRERTVLKTMKVLRLSMHTMSSASEEVILKTVKDNGIIILNRPNRLNAYNCSMLQQMIKQLKVWNEGASLVIIKGAGGKAFCAGGDIRYTKELAQKKDPMFYTKEITEYRLQGLIHTLKVPYISLLNGIVMGGGGGLSVNGRYRVATENTVYAMPETAIGVIPDAGVTYHFPRLKNYFGYFLGLTGTRLRGKDVFHAGIATHTCDSKRLQDLEDELLQVDTNKLQKSNVFEAVENILNKFTRETEFGLQQPFTFDSKMGKISRAFSADTVEKILGLLKKDDCEWSRETAEALESMCPLSLKVALRQLREGNNMSLLEGLILEHRLCVRLCSEYNFFEGVRAVVEDKDRNPKWQPSSLEEVSDEMVERYFNPLPEGQELTFV